MIFKKPDAFIIKHIKLIHVIILLGMGFLLFKTSEISTVYDEVAKTKTIIGENYSGEIYNIYMYLILLFCLTAVVLIMIILIKRKKKFLFYIALTILMAWMLVFYFLSSSNIKTMQRNDVAAPVYLAYHDVSQMLFYTQSVFVFVLLFKTTGFDIKTFSFGNISYDLGLDDIDDEEIEFNVEIDGNELRTKRNRKIRNLKYYYFEHRWKLNSIIILSTAILLVAIQIIVAANRPVYHSLGEELFASDYSLIINKVYLSNTDYNGKTINKDGTSLVLTFKLKKNKQQEYTFDSSNISIVINDKAYHPNSKYYGYFTDLGTAYKEQKLTLEYTDYYLVYQIPYDFSTKDIYIKAAGNFNWASNKYNYYEIKTTYERLDSSSTTTKEFSLHDEMNVDAYGVKGNVTINDFEIKDKFKVVSNAQVEDKSYILTEYITPTAADNEEKAILMISYEEKKDTNDKKIDFEEILSKYAIIEYSKDNNKKEAKIYSRIIPTLSKEPNIYYFQVSKGILEGTNRTIKIKIRNQEFTYKLD